MKRRFLLVTLLAVVLAGCKVDATVSVRVNDDGSGVVRVFVVADAEAVKAAESGGTKLEQAVRLSDLTSSGWQVSPWDRAPDGSASVEITRRFTAVDEVASILGDISGPDGPLQGVQITRERGVLTTSYSSSGRADLTNVQSGIAADPELVTNLSGQQVDVTTIDQQLLAQVRASFGLKVVVKLPGERARTFTPKPGATLPLGVSSSVLDTDRILFGAAAIGFLILAIVVLPLRPRRRGLHSPPPRRRR